MRALGAFSSDGGSDGADGVGDGGDGDDDDGTLLGSDELAACLGLYALAAGNGGGGGDGARRVFFVPDVLGCAAARGVDYVDSDDDDGGGGGGGGGGSGGRVLRPRGARLESITSTATTTTTARRRRRRQRELRERGAVRPRCARGAQRALIDARAVRAEL